MSDLADLDRRLDALRGARDRRNALLAGLLGLDEDDDEDNEIDVDETEENR